MKWKSDLFNNIVRMGIYLLLWGVSSDMVAQEDVKRIVRDSVRTSSEIQEGNSFSVSFLHEDFSVSDEKTLSFPLPQPTPTDSFTSSFFKEATCSSLLYKSFTYVQGRLQHRRDNKRI